MIRDAAQAICWACGVVLVAPHTATKGSGDGDIHRRHCDQHRHKDTTVAHLVYLLNIATLYLNRSHSCRVSVPMYGMMDATYALPDSI